MDDDWTTIIGKSSTAITDETTQSIKCSTINIIIIIAFRCSIGISINIIRTNTNGEKCIRFSRFPSYSKERRKKPISFV